MAKTKRVRSKGSKKQKGGFGQFLSGLFGLSNSSGQSQSHNSVEEKAVDANQSFVGGKTKKKHQKRKSKK